MPRIVTPAGALLLVLTALAVPACTTDDGFRNTYRSQTEVISADVQQATQIVEAVLEDLELEEVEATATKVDGVVTANTADESNVIVNLERKTDQTTAVKVRVGTLGDPDLGLLILKRIKERVED